MTEILFLPVMGDMDKGIIIHFGRVTAAGAWDIWMHPRRQHPGNRSQDLINGMDDWRQRSSKPARG